jgi:Protein of unknown function (DUF3995)
MITFLSLTLILIFTSIAAIHFYWAFGGIKWSTFVIPTRNDAPEAPLFRPRLLETLAVAIGFVVFAWIVGMNAQLFPIVWLTPSYVTYATFGIALLFLLRAVSSRPHLGKWTVATIHHYVYLLQLLR